MTKEKKLLIDFINWLRKDYEVEDVYEMYADEFLQDVAKTNSDQRDVMQRYLVSDVIFVEIKNGKITDKRGTEISTEFILQHEHYLGKGWGYVIL